MNLPVVILCGGKGLRIRSEYPDSPKPLIKVDEKTILERVIDIFILAGCQEIFLCLGYKDRTFLEYFAGNECFEQYDAEGFVSIVFRKDIKLTMVNTGIETTTAGRLKLMEKYIISYETFFMTYADGISDISISDLLNYHREKGCVATVTAVKPNLNFGVLGIEDGIVKTFYEKPKSKEWINGGFFVFDNEIFDFLEENDVLEVETVSFLAKKEQLSAFQYDGWWMCMDTYKDYLAITEYFVNREYKE